MELVLTIFLVVVHIVLLYRIAVEAGFLWFIGCLLLPILTLVVAYLHWRELRGVFLTEVVLAGLLFLVS